MLHNSGFLITIISTLLLSYSTAHAVEPLSTEELISHCKHHKNDPDGKDGIFCLRYIQGFIDGAVATDERVTRNVVEDMDKKESFSERAIRTRAPQLLDRYGPTFYAEFCLGDPVPLLDVVNVVVRDLLKSSRQSNTSGNAREVVYQSLRENFPCTADR